LETSLDLFDAGASSCSSTKLDVVKLDYLGSELIGWKELFFGFDSIRAITFSSGVGFVYQLLDLFADAEIVF